MPLKLVYFKMRALAEAPQLLLHYAGIDYQYLMSWDYYGDEWSKIKPRVSFKQLPVLIVDETHEIAQSIAILSYIEKLDKSLLAKFPLLEKFLENIETIVSLRSYLNTRPKLIDVSVMPKLVIDGVPHPTGIQKP